MTQNNNRGYASTERNERRGNMNRNSYDSGRDYSAGYGSDEDTNDYYSRRTSGGYGHHDTYRDYDDEYNAGGLENGTYDLQGDRRWNTGRERQQSGAGNDMQHRGGGYDSYNSNNYGQSRSNAGRDQDRGNESYRNSERNRGSYGGDRDRGYDTYRSNSNSGRGNDSSWSRGYNDPNADSDYYSNDRRSSGRGYGDYNNDRSSSRGDNSGSYGSDRGSSRSYGSGNYGGGADRDRNSSQNYGGGYNSSEPWHGGRSYDDYDHHQQNRSYGNDSSREGQYGRQSTQGQDRDYTSNRGGMSHSRNNDSWRNQDDDYNESGRSMGGRSRRGMEDMDSEQRSNVGQTNTYRGNADRWR